MSVTVVVGSLLLGAASPVTPEFGWFQCLHGKAAELSRSGEPATVVASAAMSLCHPLQEAAVREASDRATDYAVSKLVADGVVETRERAIAVVKTVATDGAERYVARTKEQVTAEVVQQRATGKSRPR